MAQTRYKTEVYIPIHKDVQSFEERQKSLWETRHADMWGDMHERMQKHRREWEEEVGKLRRDFFKLKPLEMRRDSSENLLESRGLDHIFYDDTKSGDKRFRVSFEVSQFKPDEISVRTQDDKLMVHAKHEEKSEGRSESREFSRSVDLPKHVNPDMLQCTLSKDGILQVEAPVPAPAYDKIRDTASRGGAIQPSTVQELRAGPAYTSEDGARKLKMCVEIGTSFQPGDIIVKTVDKKLLVRAKHEEKSAGRTSIQEFSREFDLPEDVDPNTVTASLGEDGRLMIEAPLGSYTHGTYEGKPGSTKQPKVTISLR